LTLIESRSVGGKGADANHNPGPPITAGDGGNGVFATSFTAVAACASTLEAGVEGAGEPAGTPGEALALAGGSTFSPGDCLQVPDSFGTIQAAIDAAVDGDLILIAPGTYEEAPIVVGKRLTLASQEGGERPMIQSSGIALVVTGEADVTLRFLELHGADAPDAPLGEDAEAGSAALVAANSAITLVNTWLWGGDGGLGGDEFSLGRRGGDGGPGAVIADAPEVTLELAYLFGGDGGRGGPGIDGGVGGDGGVGLSLANTSMFDASLSTCEGGVGGAAGVSIDTPPIAGGGGRGGDALRASAVQGRAETFWMLGGAGGNFFVAGAGVGGDSLVATEGTRLCAYELYGEPGPGGQGMSSVTGPTGEALILSEDSTIALPPQVVAQLVISPQPMGTYHSSTQRAASDANRDGAVDAADVVQMVALWDACEEP
jgi:hypothetical protein